MARTTSMIEDPQSLKEMVEQSLEADKAEDITTIPLDESAALADYMIVATGTSTRHLKALAEKLYDRLCENRIKNVHVEGAHRGDWIVMDVGDVIVHLFRPEVRLFYNIEKMWQVSDYAVQAAESIDGANHYLTTIR